MRKIVISLLLVIFLLASLVSADSLIFYESFDNQDSLNANSCISCSVTSFAEGTKANAAYFGAGSSLTYPALNNINNSKGTISFWVKPVSFNNGNPGGNGFFDFGDLGSASSLGVFRNNPSNYVYFEVKDDGNVQHGPIFKNNALSIEKWTNIVITYEFNTGGDGIMRLYINGSSYMPWSGMNIAFNPSDSYFQVGDAGWYERADAYIDELKIYDYVKPTFEIYNDYNEMINYTPPIIEPVKPQSNGTVKINSSGLFVNNKSFYMKGVDYQPTPIGENYGYDFFSHPEIYNRDFALLRGMNANTIRPWATVTNSDFLDAAYNNGINPIYVIMPFYIGTTDIDYSDPATRETLKQNFRNYVNQFKDHPAVLMWSIGNENNLHYQGDISYWYSLVNEMAQDAYAIEGAYYHTVTCVNWETHSLGDPSKNSDDASMNYLDAWGINVYRGKTFGTFFGDYKILSSRPLWISEYGVDAWHTTNLNNPSQGYEDEDSQAEWDLAMWKKIVSEDTIGATVMEYSDEWQKDWNTQNPNAHDYGGYQAIGAHPDDYSNEEWYGIMRTVDNGNNPDIMQPREVYYALQEAFREKVSINITLNQGWNLISIPLILDDNLVSSVFSGISYSKLFTYDSVWKVPTEINNTLGYWIKADNNDILTVKGLPPENDLSNLNTGWNLIGYPSLNETNISEMFDNVTVYMYNNSNWYSYITGKPSNTLTKFIPGYGYWVKK